MKSFFASGVSRKLVRARDDFPTARDTGAAGNEQPSVNSEKQKMSNEVSEQTVGTPALSATPRSAAEIAEAVLGKIEWKTATGGFCECPGRSKHTTEDAARDCVVYLDRVPTAVCFHSSCGKEVAAANRKLRAMMRHGSTPGCERPKRLTAEEKARIAESKRLENLRLSVASAKQQILTQHRWTYAEIQASSPVVLPDDASWHFKLLLEKFDGKDVLWIGDKFDSGKPGHARHFRLASEWLKVDAAPAQFICPVAFKPGSYARTNENVEVRRFLVVESDVLGKDEVGAVFRWLKEKVGLELAAVVDTAGKSLHAWFLSPRGETMAELKVALPELGCDPKLFTPSQPVRLPGALRGERHQRLVYLAGKEVLS